MGLTQVKTFKKRDVKSPLQKPPVSLLNVGRCLWRQSIYAPVAPTLCRIFYVAMV